MKKILLASALLFTSVSAQDITLSTDSVRVYNNPISSMAYHVRFMSHSSSAIRLDSAFIQIDEIDTVGIGEFVIQNKLEADWSGDYTNNGQFTWSMDKISTNLYRLNKKVFTPSSAEPLSFGSGSDSADIINLKIGYCFQCALIPKYPRYIRGYLKMYFSNNQLVNLRFYSGFTSKIRQNDIGLFKSENFVKSDKYTVNGQRLPKGSNRGTINSQRARLVTVKKELK